MGEVSDENVRGKRSKRRSYGEREGICQISDRIREGAQARKFHSCHTAEMRVAQDILCKEERGLENFRSKDCRCRMRLN